MNARVANEGMSNPKLIDPTPELPDDTQLDNVDLPARIRAEQARKPQVFNRSTGS